MEHEELKQILYQYCDGETDPGQNSLFLEHLNSCPECQSELALWKKTRELGFPIPVIKNQGKFAERVMASIQAKNPAEVTAPSWLDLSILQWKVAFAMGVLVLALVFPIERTFFSDNSDVLADYETIAMNGESALFSETDLKKDELMGLLIENEENLPGG